MDRERARSLLASEPYSGTDLQDLALARRQAVVLDGEYVPLATATPAVIDELVFGIISPPPAEVRPDQAFSS